MFYLLLVLFIVFWSLAIFMMMELDWKTGEWKNERYKGKLFPINF